MTTVVTSRFGLLIDTLLQLLRAVPALADPVQVYDGPDVTDSEWADAVFIGFDGDWNGKFDSVRIKQDWSYLGATSRFEEVDIVCSVVSWSGDVTPKPNRDRAIVLLGAVETVLRTDPTLGLDSSVIATLDVANVFQEPFQNGHGCRILFTIHIRDQILTS